MTLILSDLLLLWQDDQHKRESAWQQREDDLYEQLRQIEKARFLAERSELNTSICEQLMKAYHQITTELTSVNFERQMFYDGYSEHN